MVNYYVRRTARVFVTIFGVMSLTFGLIRLLPGGPFTLLRTQLLQQGIPAEQVNQQIENLQNVRPDAPLHEQYINYMISAVQLDLGTSIQYSRPVTEVVAQAAPWTIFIVVVSTILMFAVGIVLGAIQAYWEGSKFDTIASSLSIVGMSIPFYVAAILLLLFMSYRWGLFPASGTANPNIENHWSLDYAISVFRYGALPILSYTIVGIGGQALAMRGNSIQVLGEDFVEVARLRGLSDSRIALRYVARNAILPMYTGFLLLLGFRLGGTVILEQIFNYPGLGLYLLDAVNSNDYPMMMGTFLVITVALVIGVYVADLTYSMIDPRISSGDSSEAY
ncbi:ABC transporter permease [Halosimplex pelagicum]|uniref:ABC transporter permease n=1 Tax=Halosimplex pelagicum TaxID=869886 RepID=A0A7D5TFY4_9EURY|nr:ABC transporter permease [Halosimplex pelagicum]QLH84715.1 ABC transporter permease [Halosimplex pelagicum]